ncbi:MAG: acyl carrier protein [Sphingobacteriales bacterium 17-39-43]|jgi:acyl carrier protein|uniref:phosphopantetheine-binding protein n=1 Tax=Daejeonella sp. TaxID=2805397 RepID=UPI000BC5655A|nr:phosphopantetheine-binding protein [Daejeonella sp.]OYZ32194.1 MAG: acyl carrier protein [Sphingobacteriales bacterium 16-39-50]OZA25538.1 MAG: acyl carrier protein [Sphingobacteriales bacterium 17-39-43]OZA58595.1 MAG: acyl carrier protein [Sphingobacteriales bacterium 39-40-5]HQS06321.1 phosphopantetheine-binding protein [Daejeonella sp.]HQS50935.1 phosphopantetheine-binding protein [Daejeonella sp.]
MERQEIIDGLIEVLKTVRMIEPEKLVGVTEETDFLADMSVPSSQMIAIVAKVEQKFDIEFEDDDIDDLGSTVKDVVDLILKVKARG